MLIRFGYTIEIACNAPTPLATLLDLHPERQKDLVAASRPSMISLKTGLEVPFETHLDAFGNLCRRLTAPPGGMRLEWEGVVRDSGLPDRQPLAVDQITPDNLPTEVLPYLLPSRYCEVDELCGTAWSLFGHTQGGWSRVQAICDFVHQHLTFGYQFARNTRTARQAFEEGVGVCRDFAHLAVTLCRCVNIPARYCNGYLGDIGVPFNPAPMDYNAWFEVYLDGSWHTFDARHNEPRIGRILVSRGRDAADIPMILSFGLHGLNTFHIVTEEIIEDLRLRAIAA